MADEHIDNAETQTYGPKLRDNLTRAFADSAPEVKAFIAWLVKQQAEADARMAEGMAKARGGISDLSAAASAKSPEVEAARKALKGFQKHLEAKHALGEWSGDIKVFLPKGLSSLTSAPALATALADAQKGFAKDTKVPDGKKFQKLLAAAEKTLRKQITATGGAQSAARAGLSEQSAEKKAWRATYYGIAKIADGLITLERRDVAPATVVPHLAVPSSTTKKAAAAKRKATKAKKAAPPPSP